MNEMRRPLNSPLLTTWSILLLLSCATTSRDWQRAVLTNTTESYQEFETRHPRSKYAREAVERSENLAWTEAREKQDWERYLREYPNGRFADSARSGIEERDYYRALSANTLSACRHFQQEHSGSRLLPLVVEDQDVLLQARCRALSRGPLELGYAALGQLAAVDDEARSILARFDSRSSYNPGSAKETDLQGLRAEVDRRSSLRESLRANPFRADSARGYRTFIATIEKSKAKAAWKAESVAASSQEDARFLDDFLGSSGVGAKLNTESWGSDLVSLFGGMSSIPDVPASGTDRRLEVTVATDPTLSGTQWHRSNDVVSVTTSNQRAWLEVQSFLEEPIFRGTKAVKWVRNGDVITMSTTNRYAWGKIKGMLDTIFDTSPADSILTQFSAVREEPGVIGELEDLLAAAKWRLAVMESCAVEEKSANRELESAKSEVELQQLLEKYQKCRHLARATGEKLEDIQISQAMTDASRSGFSIPEVLPIEGSYTARVSVTGVPGREYGYLKYDYPSDGPIMLGDGTTVRFPLGNGSVHRYIGRSKCLVAQEAEAQYVFIGDDDDPLSFALLWTDGYVYLHGKGKVIFPDGKGVELGY